MANQIRLKRASGSDPSASDLVTGELAVRTDTAKLFTKKDDNSVVEIGGISDGDKGDITVSSSGTAFTIDNNAVTYAKMQDVSATNRVLGRDSSGGGIIEEITPANLRTMLNVADGATNVTNTNQLTNGAGFITATLTNEQVQDIVGGMVSGNTESGITVTYQDGDGTLDFSVASQTDENFTTTLKNKLDGIESGATADQTAAEIKTLLNSNQLEAAQIAANAITSGKIPNSEITLAKITDIPQNRIVGRISSGSGVMQELTAANVRSIINVADGATNVTNTNQLTNGAGFITSADGGNANQLDGLSSSQFLRSDANDSASGLITLSTGLALGGSSRCTASVTALSDGSTITVDFTAGIHHSVTLGGNRTFGNPSNDASAVGQSGSIFITQDGTGSRTASFHGDYKFPGGTAPTLSTTANAVDRLDYVIKSSGVIHCVVTLDVK